MKCNCKGLKPDPLCVTLLLLRQAHSRPLVKTSVCYLSFISPGHFPWVSEARRGESVPFGTGPSFDGLGLETQLYLI